MVINEITKAKMRESRKVRLQVYKHFLKENDNDWHFALIDTIRTMGATFYARELGIVSSHLNTLLHKNRSLNYSTIVRLFSGIGEVDIKVK